MDKNIELTVVDSLMKPINIFIKWFDTFKEKVLDQEFEGGKSEIEETPEKLTFKFQSEWYVTVEKQNNSKDKNE